MSVLVSRFPVNISWVGIAFVAYGYKQHQNENLVCSAFLLLFFFVFAFAFRGMNGDSDLLS